MRKNKKQKTKTQRVNINEEVNNEMKPHSLGTNPRSLLFFFFFFFFLYIHSPPSRYLSYFPFSCKRRDNTDCTRLSFTSCSKMVQVFWPGHPGGCALSPGNRNVMLVPQVRPMGIGPSECLEAARDETSDYIWP